MKQEAKERAAYGEKVIKELSKRLTAEFNKGFRLRHLKIVDNFTLHFKIG